MLEVAEHEATILSPLIFTNRKQGAFGFAPNTCIKNLFFFFAAVRTKLFTLGA